MSVSGSSPVLTKSTAARSDATVSWVNSTLTAYRMRLLSLAMATMANDSGAGVAVRAGLLLAGVSAVSFGLSGPLARGLIDVGWSPGAVVLARIAIAALVVAPLAARALRARWGLLRRNVRIVLLYGAVPVAGTQFAFFSAVAAMDVGPALLIEYTAPAAIVVWLWLRHGERPAR